MTLNETNYPFTDIDDIENLEKLYKDYEIKDTDNDYLSRKKAYYQSAISKRINELKKESKNEPYILQESVSQKKYKCPLCGKVYFGKDIEALYTHIETDHSDLIPKDWSGARYLFYTKHGRGSGKCRICGSETKWNDKTNRPYVFCENPKCRKIYRNNFVSSMVKKHGKAHLLNDPDVQKKMLMNRSISGTYSWSDGGKTSYVGSFEKDFQQFLDLFIGLPSREVQSPAPQIFEYDIEIEDTKEKKHHFYIPDMYLESLNTIVEIKDGGNNPNTHPKIMAVDKLKEKAKDNILKNQKEYNYIKITNKNYAPFIKFLFELKQKDDYKNSKFKPSVIISEQLNLLENNIETTGSIYIIFYLNESDIMECAFSTCINNESIYKYDPTDKNFIELSQNDIKRDCAIYVLRNSKYNTDSIYNLLEILRNKENPYYNSFMIDDSLFFIFNLINMSTGEILIENNSDLVQQVYHSNEFRLIHSNKEGLTDFNIEECIKKLSESNLDKSIVDKYINSAILSENVNNIKYGIPELELYPLNNITQLNEAIVDFKNCEEKYKGLLVRNILDVADEYGIELPNYIMNYKDDDFLALPYTIEPIHIVTRDMSFDVKQEINKMTKIIDMIDNPDKKDIAFVLLKNLKLNYNINDELYNHLYSQILIK